MFSWSLFLLLLISCIHHRVASEEYVDPDQKHPIIIIPGLLGSSMEAKKDGPFSSWRTIWYTKDAVHPTNGGAVDRWVQDFRREFTADVNDAKTKNPDGLKTRVVGWGSTDGIEDLSSYSRSKLIDSQNSTPRVAAYVLGRTAYFKNMVTQLVKGMHYTRKESILGAPYDFRRAPYDNLDYFDKLNTLILDTYIANGNKSVIIISHSMGCLQFLYLLQSKSQKWKNQFIRGWIPIAGPFGGSVKMLSALIKGEALHMNWYVDKMKRLMRTFSSSYFLLPDERVFGNETVLTRYYRKEGKDQLIKLTAKDIRHILFDIYDLKDDIRMFDAASGDLNGSIYDQHPGVNTHCVYSHGISTTVEIFSFREEQHYDDHTYNGDGSTLYLSAELCKKWVNSDSATNDSYQEYHGIDHMGLVTDDEAVSHIISIVEKLNDCRVKYSPVKEDLSGGAIAGITIGVLIASAALSGCVWWVILYSRSGSELLSNQSNLLG